MVKFVANGRQLGPPTCTFAGLAALFVGIRDRKWVESNLQYFSWLGILGTTHEHVPPPSEDHEFLARDSVLGDGDAEVPLSCDRRNNVSARRRIEESRFVGCATLVLVCCRDWAVDTRLPVDDIGDDIIVLAFRLALPLMMHHI